MENAEWWLRMAADRGIEVASYLVYKAYRDGKFTEKPSDKLRYLRMAVDKKFGYAEYEYAKYLMDKSPEDAKIYFERAASHGSFQAEYTYGKMLYDEGKRDEAREWFERSARTDAWTQTRVGLLLYYEYEDHEAGKAFHDLRHTFATHATDGGVDPKTLAGILGHTDASFTLDTYTHVTGDMQRNAMTVVNSMMQQFLITEKPDGKE